MHSPTPFTLQFLTKFPSGFWGLLLVGVFACWNLASWPARLSFPGDGSLGGDSIPVAELLHLRQEVPIYAQPTAEQYDGANWGPLYYLLGSRLVNPETISYRPLRILSLAGTLGCAALVGLLAYWIGGYLLGSAIAALLFLGFGFVAWNGVAARCDSIALLLCLAGFCVAFRFQNNSRLLFSIPFLLLGWLFKPLFLAAPVAIAVFLLRSRRYRLALQFCGLFAVGGSLSLAFFQWIVFPGEEFFRHFVTYNALPFQWGILPLRALFFGTTLLVPFIAADEYLRRNPDSFLRAYCFLSLFLSLLTASRLGSNTYYFMELAAILSTLTGLLLCRLPGAPAGRVALLSILGTSLWMGTWFRTPPPPGDYDVAADQAVQDYLREHFPPGTLALGYFSADLLRAGFEVPITNLYHYRQLVRKGVIEDMGLVRQLRSHRFGVLVLPHDINHPQSLTEDFYLTERARQAVLENYRLLTVLDSPAVQSFGGDHRFHVWVPANQE
jgi:hypothetical protein